MVSMIPLERGWSAVLHAPLPDAGVLAVELLRHGKLLEFVHDPEDVEPLVEVLLLARVHTERGAGARPDGIPGLLDERRTSLLWRPRNQRAHDGLR
jgi:hypothetical protein